MPPKASLLLIHSFLLLVTVNLVITIPTANDYAERLGAGRLLLVMQSIPKFKGPNSYGSGLLQCICVYTRHNGSTKSFSWGESLDTPIWTLVPFFVQNIFIAQCRMSKQASLLNQWFVEDGVCSNLLCNAVVELT